MPHRNIALEPDRTLIRQASDTIYGMTRRRAVILAVLALAVAACTGQISREEAARVALANAGAVATVEWVEPGPLSRFVDATTLPDEPRDRSVWAVMLHGSFPGTCVITPTGSSVCPTGRTAKLVIVDGQTGAFLVSVSS